MKKSVKAEGNDTSCGSNEMFTRWLPGGREQGLTKEEEQWFKDRPLHKPGFTAYYRCGMLNWMEEERFLKKYKIVNKELIDIKSGKRVRE